MTKDIYNHEQCMMRYLLVEKGILFGFHVERQGLRRLNIFIQLPLKRFCMSSVADETTIL
jgi:hypothetical protein